MNLAPIGNCRKCGDGYFSSGNSTGYCSNFCKDTDYTVDLEERIEALEGKIESMARSNKCIGCGDEYNLPTPFSAYCCDVCKNNTTHYLEERIEVLEGKIEIIQEQLNKCLSILNVDNSQKNNDV